MASFQARQRDPLLDQNTQALLERRGKELLGGVLIFLGVLAAMMLASYAPTDPSWMAASDEAAQNWLGRIGAGIASPLMVIVGHGAWLLPAALVIWGGRFVLHRGEERIGGRAIFFPIGVAMASVYASLLEPGTDWGQTFGLGGNFGDMIAGSVWGMSPVSGSLGLNLITVLFAALTLVVGAFVLGFVKTEIRAIVRFMLLGTVAVYASLMTLLGKGASASVMAARSAAEHQRQRRAEKAAAAEEWAAWEAQRAQAQEWQPAYHPEPVERGSLLSRIIRPQQSEEVFEELEPELVETQAAWLPETDAPTQERIRARISQAVQQRQLRAEPPVSAEAYVPLPERAPEELPAPPSVLAAVAKRLALGPRAPQTLRQTETRVEPRLAAQPMPQEPVMDYAPAPEWDEAPALYAEDDFDAQAFAYEGDGYADEAFVEDDYFPEDHEIPAAPARMELNRQVIQKPEQRRVVMPQVKPIAPSRRAMEEAQPRLALEQKAHPAYEIPPLSLLMNPVSIERHQLSDEALEENARMLENVLDDYGVKGEIVSVRPGPVVTMYELEPAPGLKASRVIGLADDIARSMSALSARVSTVPGRSVIGIELPNAHREKVVLREILSARDFGDSNMKLPLALGKDIGGEPMVANLAKMPHLLIAGTTGSGKSVAINTMILSLLYKLSPEECRLIMIDPKMLELSVYDGIPHLLSPVVTDPKKAVVALKWVVAEMEERYRKMSKMGVRNIEGYNGRVKESLAKGEMFKRTVQTGFDEDTGEPIFETEEFQPATIPYIVVIVDEMADLMMVAGKEIEACIQRLAQMARASGIHLIMATQRPSVDVITGTIKANFPTRISFQVTSKIDSRTILGEMGAEQLLGMGDMLYMAGGGKITRCHGPFVSDEEVEEIVNHLKSFGPPEYMSGVVEGPDEDKEADIDAVLGLNSGGNTSGEDALYDQAVGIVIKDRKCSTSYIQRKLGIGYNKAARLVEQMEDQGVVSPANHVGKREILVPEQ
ncbi:DNA translocase FtsK 4TM domain-containing protein [Thioclava sp. A2]|uniref:DNA translocase FtsK n=1 Tax=Thioclava sp. FCG-A2 TaxID=3080562 RepID=UPI002954920E|nr:DNA translocase FtsK 4TM domain-containing protein [Thioclava sp. A2]MDV7271659.1 DNA translocase FtsK 4TM domain-containing protein [Thioclava sp. A2]